MRKNDNNESLTIPVTNNLAEEGVYIAKLANNKYFTTSLINNELTVSTGGSLTFKAAIQAVNLKQNVTNIIIEEPTNGEMISPDHRRFRTYKHSRCNQYEQYVQRLCSFIRI